MPNSSVTCRALAGFVGLVAALAVAGGCKSKGKTTPDQPPDPVVPDAGLTSDKPADLVDELLDLLVGYRDRACACTDAACFGAIRDEMSAWAEEHSDQLADLHPTQEQDQKGEQLMNEIDACQSKVAGGVAGQVEVGEVLAQMEIFRDQVCRCGDQACIDSAEGDFLEWIKKRAEQLQGLEPTPDEEKRAAAIEKTVEDCKAKITGATP